MLLTIGEKKDRNIEITPHFSTLEEGTNSTVTWQSEALLAGLSYVEKSGQLLRFLSLYYDTQKKVQVYSWY